MPIQQAFSALNHFQKFSETEIAIIKKVAEVRILKKKEIILAFGEKEQYINCITKGLVRKFIMNGDKAISTEFASEGNVICSNSSFGTQMPSEYSIDAIENSTMVSFTMEGLEWLYGQSPVFFNFWKIMFGSSLLQSEEREIMLMKFDAQKRFDFFMRTKGDFFLRLPQNMIASYLNVQPETLSKLKRYYIY